MRIFIDSSLVAAALILSVTGLSTHAAETERFNALGITLSGSTGVDIDSNSGAISIDYARVLRGTRWYGSGFSCSVEFERERERDDATKQIIESETVYLAAGVFCASFLRHHRFLIVGNDELKQSLRQSGQTVQLGLTGYTC